MAVSRVVCCVLGLSCLHLAILALYLVTKMVAEAGGVDWARTESASSQLGVAEAGGVDWARTESASSQLRVTPISSTWYLNTTAASRGLHCGPPQGCSCFKKSPSVTSYPCCITRAVFSNLDE